MTGPDLITTKQAADRLGVNASRVRALSAHRADFPKPAIRTGNSILWNAEQIETWARTADRRPGRRWDK